ncbi:MAG: hypothetical protein IJX14_12045, partial [Clostridia bacterium]|nr:hypothetical protein [Clostridia bacterium]
TSAAGRSLYAASIGEDGDLPSVVFAGTDPLSSTILLRFLAEYSGLLAEGGRLYRVYLPCLFAGRRICVCPVINPDAMEPAAGCAAGTINGLGADIAEHFTDSPPEVPEKCPEAAALRQYLLYGEPALFCTIRCGSSVRLDIPPQPAARAGTVGRLLTRMLADTDTSDTTTRDAITRDTITRDTITSAPITRIPAWYAAGGGHLAYGITLREDGGEEGFYRAYASVRELLYSAALLI